MWSERARRRWAPLFLIAAAVGAYVAVSPNLPRERRVILDFGTDPKDVTDVEVSWTRAGSSGDAALTTRWHFARGALPRRLPYDARLAEGDWDIDVRLERESRETTRWAYRVNLQGAPFFMRAPEQERPVVIPVREALR